MNSMPSFLSEFLELGDVKLNSQVKPSWLINSFSDDYWQIKIPGESRLAGNKWLGCRRLFWTLKLPGGHLTDNRWSILMEDAKLLCLSHIENPAATASNPRSLKNFQTEILNLCEHLIVHYPLECEQLGLSMISIDKVERYLADHLEAGTAGTGYWIKRFEAYIFSQIETPYFDAQYLEWQRKQGASVSKAIDNIFRSIVTVDPPNLPKKPDMPQLNHKVINVRRWFALNDWYDPMGCINLDRFADAIDVDRKRVAGNAYLKYYLRVFELCCDYRTLEATWTYREHLGHRAKTITQQATSTASGCDQAITCKFISDVSNYSQHINKLENSSFAALDIHLLPTQLKGNDHARTPTLPINTALYIYDNMIHWVLQYSRPLMHYYLKLLNYALKHQGSARRKYGTKNPLKDISIEDCVWEKAFASISIPKKLAELKLQRVAPLVNRRAESMSLFNIYGGSIIPSLLRENGMTVIDAMRINAAVIAGLIAALSLRRVNEILLLKRDCIFMRDGRPYLTFSLEKVGLDGVRENSACPIPKLLYQTLSEYQILANSLVEVETYRKHDPLLSRQLFIIPTDTGGKIMNGVELGIYLDLFTDWIQVPLDQHNRRWYFKIHECRRFGAMSFFRLSGMESSLPALSWFMGHKDIKQTWRYVQEKLTGKELTQSEVAMAHEAIIRANHGCDVEGVYSLKSVVLKHFGVDHLGIISPAEIDDYLELLHEEGVYRVLPHSIFTKEGTKHTILIQMIEESNYATSN